jgi:hypothetical protein
MEQIQSKEKIVKPSLVEIKKDYLNITVSGYVYSFNLSSVSPRLAAASSSVQHNFTLSPSGYGIHWPDIDEDISIPALLKTNK